MVIVFWIYSAVSSLTHCCITASKSLSTLLFLSSCFSSFKQWTYINVQCSDLSLTRHAAINLSRGTLQVEICKWNGNESVGVQDWLWRNAHHVQMNVEIMDFKASSTQAQLPTIPQMVGKWGLIWLLSNMVS
jgi:hypothetical protein